MRDYRKLLRAGNKAQLEKLKQNTHKNDFDNLGLHYIYYRMEQELKELQVELFAEDGRTPKTYNEIDFAATRLEFADNSNFSDMGILACDKEIAKCSTS